MNKLSLLIVDDEPLAHDVIKDYCAKIDFVEVAGSCYDGISTINFLHEHSIDALILDIQMPDLTGLELLDTLKEKSPKIIFTTAYTDYALQSFEYDQVVDYLHKPVRITRFIKAIDRLKHQLELEQKAMKNPATVSELGQNPSKSIEYIIAKQDKITFKIAVREIQYLQSWGNYLKVHLSKNEVKIIRKTLSEMDAALKESGFCRIHNSYMVNIEAVKGIDGNQVLIEDQRLPVSRAFRNSAMERLLK